MYWPWWTYIPILMLLAIPFLRKDGKIVVIVGIVASVVGFSFLPFYFDPRIAVGGIVLTVMGLIRYWYVHWTKKKLK